MCREDLKLGRGRYPDGQVSAAVSSATVPALPPNPLRVAILFAGTGAAPGGQIVIRFGTGTGVITFTMIDGTTPPVLMRIEDYGQLITQSVFFNDNGTGTNVSITAISTQATAEPIGLGPET